MTTLKIENLLVQVLEINEKYKKIAQLTGANFNIFNILELKTKEVRLHSKLIAELLNPNGSHGQKDIFLNLFLNCIGINDYCNSPNTAVKVEEDIGAINEDKTNGGRIDIIIKISNLFLFIENKIYAHDQENQLLRYHNYNKEAKIIYLTLDGKEAAEKYDFEYIKISYKKEILNWLELCLKEATLLPNIRETLSQYINIVKQLTNQTMESNEIKEIKELILKNPEYAEAIKKCQDALTLMIEDFDDNLFNSLKYENIVLNDKTEINKWFDYEDLHFYYQLQDSNKKSIIDDNLLKPLREIFNKNIPEFKTQNTNNIGYFLPKVFKQGEWFENLNVTKKIKLLSDKEQFRKLITDIKTEEMEYLEKILNDLKSKNLI